MKKLLSQHLLLLTQILHSENNLQANFQVHGVQNSTALKAPQQCGKA
jgi:hypothetical protein